MTDMTVANTILGQLGGNRFIRNTGASDFVGSKDSLQFSLPGKPGFVKNGINKVSVTLDPSDTYTVKFMRYSKKTLSVSLISSHSNVYVEDLTRIFTSETGLATSMGKVFIVG